MYRPIREYGIIGNLRSVALVSTHASIDWAPAPFIDSPSIFAHILDDQCGGYWQILPDVAYSSEQYYTKDSNVLTTRFACAEGVVTVTDFIPLEHTSEYVSSTTDTTYRIHRRIACSSGRVPMQMVCVPRFDYARGQTSVLPREGGAYMENGNMYGVLASHIPLHVSDNRVSARFVMEAGDVQYMILRYNTDTITFADAGTQYHDQELFDAESYWRSWARSAVTDDAVTHTPWMSYVRRSALLLKMLFFEPVGTVAAAPTTSLPEEIGGVRNWDYRYTWLRDSTFIFQALFQLGYVSEAREYIRWLLDTCYSTAGTEAFGSLQIMYGLRGERQLEEQLLPHLRGYERSQPVRIGNAAYRQQQWDIYGSVFDVVWQLYELTGERVGETDWEALRAMANHVCDIWREPDEGLWEVRGGKQHFTYSKVMCWVALDRAIRLADTFGFSADRNRWQREREEIYSTVWEHGFNSSLNTFVQCFDGEYLDASLLLLPTVGFIAGDDPRMQGTLAAIEEHLMMNDTFVLRYVSDDGLPGNEGAFLLASFWLVDAYVFAGSINKGQRLFERLLTYVNHLGLLSEEIDPHDGTFLGNFPQAYAHVGLINSAVRLARARSAQAVQPHATVTAS
jgi:GH15 family glucan-1,4-alpha-glucosidase